MRATDLRVGDYIDDRTRISKVLIRDGSVRAQTKVQGSTSPGVQRWAEDEEVRVYKRAEAAPEATLGPQPKGVVRYDPDTLLPSYISEIRQSDSDPMIRRYPDGSVATVDPRTREEISRADPDPAQAFAFDRPDRLVTVVPVATAGFSKDKGLVYVTDPATGKRIDLGRVQVTQIGNASARGGAYKDAYVADFHASNGTSRPSKLPATYETKREALAALLADPRVEGRLSRMGLSLREATDGSADAPAASDPGPAPEADVDPSSADGERLPVPGAGVQLTPRSSEYFRELVGVMQQWDGAGLVDASPQQMGNLTDLKVKGLVTTIEAEGGRGKVAFAYLTPAGVELAESLGLDVPEYAVEGNPRPLPETTSEQYAARSRPPVSGTMWLSAFDERAKVASRKRYIPEIGDNQLWVALWKIEGRQSNPYNTEKDSKRLSDIRADLEAEIRYRGLADPSLSALPDGRQIDPADHRKLIIQARGAELTDEILERAARFEDVDLPAPTDAEPAPEVNDTPIPDDVAPILDKWVQLRGSGTLTEDERQALSRAIQTHGEKPPTVLYRGASLNADESTFPRGRMLDFGPSSTSEDSGSALPYAENGDATPVLFVIRNARKGLNVQGRAEREGFAEQEWITGGTFFSQSAGRDDEGNLVVIVSPALPPDDEAQKNATKQALRIDELSGPVDGSTDASGPSDPVDAPEADETPSSAAEEPTLEERIAKSAFDMEVAMERSAAIQARVAKRATQDGLRDPSIRVLAQLVSHDPDGPAARYVVEAPNSGDDYRQIAHEFEAALDLEGDGPNRDEYEHAIERFYGYAGDADARGHRSEAPEADPEDDVSVRGSRAYKKAYLRGWKSSSRFEGGLERADARGEPDAWYDGYMDNAAGRPRWTLMGLDEEQRDAFARGEIDEKGNPIDEWIRADLDHEAELKAIGFELPSPEQRIEDSRYVYDMMSRREITEEESEFPVNPGLLAEEALHNAYTAAVEEGFATVRTDEYGRNIYGPKAPVAELEFEAWVNHEAAGGLAGLLDGYGYDRDGKLYDFNQRQVDEKNATANAVETAKAAFLEKFPTGQWELHGDDPYGLWLVNPGGDELPVQRDASDVWVYTDPADRQVSLSRLSPEASRALRAGESPAYEGRLEAYRADPMTYSNRPTSWPASVLDDFIADFNLPNRPYYSADATSKERQAMFQAQSEWDTDFDRVAKSGQPLGHVDVRVGSDAPTPELHAELDRLTALASAAQEADDLATDKAGRGGALNQLDHYRSAKSRAAVKAVTDVAAPLRAEMLRRLAGDAQLGEVEYDTARWANTNTPRTRSAPGAIDADRQRKARDAYVVKDKNTVDKNAELRSGRPSSAAKTWRSNTNRWVNSNQAANDMVVYRGIAVPPSFVMQLVPGATIHDVGIQSTDESRGTAQYYLSTRIGYRPNAVPVMLEVLVPEGHNIVDADVGEFVLPSDQSMTIRKVESDGEGQYRVTVELGAAQGGADGGVGAGPSGVTAATVFLPGY